MKRILSRSGRPPRVEIKWSHRWSPIVIRVDGAQIAELKGTRSVKNGFEYTVPDQAQLRILYSEAAGFRAWLNDELLKLDPMHFVERGIRAIRTLAIVAWGLAIILLSQWSSSHMMDDPGESSSATTMLFNLFAASAFWGSIWLACGLLARRTPKIAFGAADLSGLLMIGDAVLALVFAATSIGSVPAVLPPMDPALVSGLYSALLFRVAIFLPLGVALTLLGVSAFRAAISVQLLKPKKAGITIP